jgi:hypothetical protein
MTRADLRNPSVKFDSELDLERIAELPGKDAMQEVLHRFGKATKRSRLIQDSHGWCFYARADDGRKYLLELSYVATKGGASDWVLSCSRCAGLRFWEWFRSRPSDTGREADLLAKGVEILTAHHGFKTTSDFGT